MIVSASRRTDVPALYADWLSRRLSAGFADVQSPYDARKVRRVCLRPAPEGDLEALVLWTRNPGPALPHLPRWERAGVRSLWLVTVTGYPRELEPAAPPAAAAVEAVRALAAAVGPERVVWRYDPVVLCDEAGLTAGWHRRSFDALSRALEGAARRCTVSLFDDYAKARRRLARAGLRPLAGDAARPAAEPLLRFLREAAEARGLEMRSCCEDLASAGIAPGACIDGDLLGRLWGLAAPGGTDPGQRSGCRCAPSVDIGAYDTCTHGCLYCYATGTPERAEARRASHEPDAARLA